MPLDIPLPKRDATAGWRLKIREKERLEPPHVTVLCKGTTIGRWGLRESAFIVPPPCGWADVPDSIRALLEEPAQLDRMRRWWNENYPENPIGGGNA